MGWWVLAATGDAVSGVCGPMRWSSSAKEVEVSRYGFPVAGSR